jgi:hypothetical protein
MDELHHLLRADREMAEGKTDDRLADISRHDAMMERILEKWPPSLRESHEETKRSQVPWWFVELRDDLRQKYADDGPATVRTALWAAENCLDLDGRLTLIDFANVHLYAARREVRIRNGIVVGNLSLRHCSSFGNSGLFNL